jgi:uncharacterized protein (DUF2461 family)
MGFLRGLEAHNDRDWFEAQRADHARDWLGALAPLVGWLQPITVA